MKTIPAKINLMLHVIGKKANGYHHLQSLVTFLSTSRDDRVSLFPRLGSDTVTLHESQSHGFQGLTTIPIKELSILKAKQWFFDFLSLPPTFFHFELIKNLPVGGGVGGGTGDGAAVLSLLADFFQISAQQRLDLLENCGVLGADMPVCLAFHWGKGPLFWVDGVGNEKTPPSIPLSFPFPPLILMISDHIVSTQRVFQKVTPPFTKEMDLPSFESSEALISFIQTTKNDLEPVTQSLFPLPPWTQWISSDQGIVRQSGSGSSFFFMPFISKEKGDY